MNLIFACFDLASKLNDRASDGLLLKLMFGERGRDVITASRVGAAPPRHALPRGVADLADCNSEQGRPGPAQPGTLLCRPGPSRGGEQAGSTLSSTLTRVCSNRGGSRVLWLLGPDPRAAKALQDAACGWHLQLAKPSPSPRHLPCPARPPLQDSDDRRMSETFTVVAYETASIFAASAIFSFGGVALSPGARPNHVAIWTNALAQVRCAAPSRGPPRHTLPPGAVAHSSCLVRGRCAPLPLRPALPSP